jgi:hypothetical protein
MRWLAGAMFAGALGAGVAALPDSGAEAWNREMATACAAARSVRAFAECPPLRRENFRTDWLLIAAVLGVGGAVVLAVGARKG